jgi:hypothetical protein
VSALVEVLVEESLKLVVAELFDLDLLWAFWLWAVVVGFAVAVCLAQVGELCSLPS